MAENKWESAFPVFAKVEANNASSVCHEVAEAICSQNVISPEKFLNIWTLDEWWTVRQFLTNFLREAVGKGWANEKILEELSGLDAQYKKSICDTVSVHRSAIRSRLIDDTTAVSHSVLTDFDWKLQLAMSSDKISQLHELLVQVDLDLREAGGEKKKVMLEMDKEELGQLIASLEQCGKSVQQLSVS